MAEGLLGELGMGRFETFSAGTEATRVRPEAIAAMNEYGVDITGQASKTLAQFLTQPFDEVITVCDQANDACPVFPGAAHRPGGSAGVSCDACGARGQRARCQSALPIQGLPRQQLPDRRVTGQLYPLNDPRWSSQARSCAPARLLLDSTVARRLKRPRHYPSPDRPPACREVAGSVYPVPATWHWRDRLLCSRTQL